MKPELIKNRDHIKVSFEKIEKFENTYNLKLETKYKKFLLDENGGSISGYYIFCHDKNDNLNFIQTVELYTLERLEEVHNITLTNKDYKYKNYYLFLKKKMLTIGYSNLAFSLCICYSKKDFGKLYYINDVHDYKFIFFANNIDDFINGFELCPEELL
ncbi:MAG: SMI1/KNR4 family protein [Candidatus Sericytochromatia bacterium]